MSNLNNYLKRPIIVFGAGSIGERHLRNLHFLGFTKLLVFRKRKLPFRTLENIKVTTLTTWDEVKKNKPIVAIISSPTSMHLLQTIECIKLGIHCLVEKPLSNNLNDFAKLNKALKKNNVYIHVGYMMRFHPLIKKIKQIINKNTYGNLLSLNSKWGEYLPDWHPWEDYRLSYAAKKELGGGVSLTLSHDIDLANYLINSKVLKSVIVKNFSSNLEIETESGSDLIVKYENGSTANIHLNFHEKKKERFLKIVFDNASINFNFYKSELVINSSNEVEKIIKLDNFNRNDLFIDQTKYFFSKINKFST